MEEQNLTTEYESKVYYALSKIAEPLAIARIANEDRMREFAPKLRQFLIDAMGYLRHGRSGKETATMVRLNLPAYPTRELMLETCVTHELQVDSAEPYEEHFFHALHAAFLYEVSRRLLHLAAEAYQGDDEPCKS